MVGGTTARAAALGAAICIAAPSCMPFDHFEGPEVPSVSILEESRRGGIVLLASSRLSEPAEVIAILDLHLAHGEHDRGLEELAMAAAEIGADAVVGVELHHGGEQLHLSGLAVRVLR
jgi:hypothetical protein